MASPDRTGPVSFKLGGTRYAVDPAEVERRMASVEPRPIDKYRVLVGGVAFPPKQVLAEVLDLPVVTFTTMDASRVLGALGFKVEAVGSALAPVHRTVSEELFEGYLTNAGLTAFQHEPSLKGTNRRPDYRLDWSGRQILLELKEFRGNREDFVAGVGSYDPYSPLREKIQAARKKFKGLEEHCCCLVLHNVDKPVVHLEWRYIYAAMLGDLTVSVPLRLSGRDVEPDAKASMIFAGGGAMVREHQGQPVEPQHQTISAVLALRHLPVGQERFRAARNERERGLGRPLSMDEYWAEVESARGTDRDLSYRELRVVVHENPYARVALPADLFRGPWDERYGADDNGQIVRLFRGERLAELERLIDAEKTAVDPYEEAKKGAREWLRKGLHLGGKPASREALHER
jgi:hypothetical protein